MTDIPVAFAGALRAQGVDVSVDRVVTYAGALGSVGLANRTWVYWAGRVTLLRSPGDLPAYDAAFSRFWLQRDRGLASPPEHQPAVAVNLHDADEDVGDDDAGDDSQRDDVRVVRYSRREVLRHKNFAAFTPAEHDEARRLLRDVALTGALRRSRRLGRARSGSRPDLRATLRAGFRTGGELVDRRWRAPTDQPRRTVILCDVSGSMEPYSRALLRFMHAAVAGGQRVEAFALGTRLTRITRELARRDPDAALDRAGQAVPDWAGGTRLGEALADFNDRWGVRGMARGAIVVILSDGWDRGDAGVLAAEMGRLHRVAHRIVWVNPLKITPGYAPLARGMAAALPFVDHFVTGHSVAALEDLARVVAAERHQRRRKETR